MEKEKEWGNRGGGWALWAVNGVRLPRSMCGLKKKLKLPITEFTVSLAYI